MWISFHCDHPILEDPGKSGKTGGPIPQEVYKVQYTPSFGVRIFRKIFALAATTLFLVPLCSLWSWSKKRDSSYQCILEKNKVTKWFNRKFDFLLTNLLEVGKDSITALYKIPCSSFSVGSQWVAERSWHQGTLTQCTKWGLQVAPIRWTISIE